MFLIDLNLSCPRRRLILKASFASIGCNYFFELAVLNQLAVFKPNGLVTNFSENSIRMRSEKKHL